jgi:hypothetical protein
LRKPVYAVGKQRKGQNEMAQSGTKNKKCAYVVQLDELFFVVPSKQNYFHEKVVFQARQKAKIDHF